MSNSFEKEQVHENELSLSGTGVPRGGTLQIVQPSPVSGIQTNALNSNSNINQSKKGYPSKLGRH